MIITTFIATILAIIGCLNWLSVGLFGFNFVTWILGAGVLSSIVFTLVGIAGIWLIFYLVYMGVNRGLSEPERSNSGKRKPENKTAKA